MSPASETGLSAHELPGSSDIAAKVIAVERAGVAFSSSIQEASAAGRGTLRRAAAVARPALLGVGLLAAAGLTIVWWHRSRTKRVLVVTRARSDGPWPGIARAAAVALAAAAGRRLAERWLRGTQESLARPQDVTTRDRAAP
jgi:hypothetical protein